MAALLPTLPKPSVKIKPIGDRVAIIPLDAEQVTKSGIVIPDTATKEKPQEGIVIALGNGGLVKDQPNPTTYLSIGDKILYARYTGDEVKVPAKDGKEMTIKFLKLESILGIVE